MRILWILLMSLWLCAAHAEGIPDQRPGYWLEAEQGSGHVRPQDWPQASGGQIVGWISEATVTTVATTLTSAMQRTRCYVRYNKAGRDGELRLRWRIAETAGETLVPMPTTGGWNRFAWTSVLLPDLPAGDISLSFGAGPSGAGGVDVLVLVEDRWDGRYQPPEYFVAGVAQGNGRLLSALACTDVALADDAVYSPDSAILWRFDLHNRSTVAIEDRLTWRIVNAHGKQVAAASRPCSLPPAGSSILELTLAQSLPVGWYRVDFANQDGPLTRRWFSCARPPAQTKDGLVTAHLPWLGMNLGHFDEDSLEKVLTDLTAVGLKAARTGGNSADPRDYDPVVDRVLGAGLELYWVINYRGNGIDPAGTSVAELADLPLDGPVMQTWFANYRARCVHIMRHFSSPGAERLRYYLVGNEPALKDTSTGLPGRPDIAVRLTQAAFEAAREVNPGGIVIQSPTGHRPDNEYLRDMIVKYGVYRYCDVIGVHVYGSQTLDQNLRAPWDYLAEVGVAMPVACTESGVTQGWAHKAKTPGREWQADYLALHAVKLRRMGYQAGVLFTHDGDHHADWALIRVGDQLIPETSEFIRTVMTTARGLRNGSFEAANQPRSDWVPDRNIDVKGWMDEQFTWQASDRVHAGRSALRINPSTWKWSISAIQVIDAGIVPGVPVTVRAWVCTSGHGPATVTVAGYDRLHGKAQVQATVVATEWTPVELTVIPTNPWIAIILAAPPAAPDADAHVWFDDIRVETGGDRIPPPDGP